MNPVLPDKVDVDIFLAIAQGGFGRDKTARVCADAGWELTAEDTDSGTLEFKAVFGDGRTVVVTVNYAGGDLVGDGDEIAAAAFAPLGCFRGAAGEDRSPYDSAFRRVADHFGQMLGSVAGGGEYPSEAPGGRPLSYCWWRLKEAAVVLVQNEFGPPLPPDVSVWVFPPRDEIRLPVTLN